jgi:hypothetical protein
VQPEFRFDKAAPPIYLTFMDNISSSHDRSITLREKVSESAATLSLGPESAKSSKASEG